MITGYYEQRDKIIGKLEKVSIYQVDYSSRYFTPKKKVTSMDNQIDFFCTGELQDFPEISEEIVSTSASFNPRLNRIIEPKMGIAKKKDLYHPYHLKY